MTDLEFMQRCKLLGCYTNDLDEWKEYIRYSHYAEQLYKNGITDNEFIIRVICNSHDYSVNTCSAVIALHKYGQDDILDRLSEEMSHLYVKEAERVKIWTDTYVVRQGTKLKVTIGKYEERVEPDIFVGTDNIYFRYVIENRECSGYERLMIDSTGNARHVTEKHRNIVRNHKTLLIALHY